jgi:serine protease
MRLPSMSAVRSALAPAVAALLLLGLPVAVPAAERAPLRPAAGAAEEPARVIVRFKQGTVRERALAYDPRHGRPPLQMARSLSQRRGITVADGPSVDERTQVMLAYGIASKALAERLAGDPDVESVEVDLRQRVHAVPNDPLYPAGQAGTPAVGQWYLRAPATGAVASIDAEAAWSITKGRDGIVVAVIDTGVRLDHPDLVGKLLPGYDFVSDIPTANDGDGRDLDPSDPGDWVSAAENASGPFRGCGVYDSTWHGTQTAGLAGAATDNAFGVAGSGWNVKVLPVRALGKCGGFVSDIAAGIRWAAGLEVPGVPANPNPARVINMSLGSSNRCVAAYQSAIDAVRAVGVVVVAAAGNEGVAVNQPGNCNGVVTVAGVRNVGTKVGYSSLGPQVVVSAPAGNCVNLTGTCLYPLSTTSNNGTTGPAANIFTGGGADATLGTSFASPLVAGTVGLMLSANPSLTSAGVTSLLKSTARPFPADPALPACRVPSGFSDASQDECNCTANTCGAGLLDAGAAVAAAQASPIPPPTAVIQQPSAIPPPGAAVVLPDIPPTGSTAPLGFTIVEYRWEIIEGADIAELIISAVPNSIVKTATLKITGAGTVVVRLTVIDSNGGIATALLTTTSTQQSQETVAVEKVAVTNSNGEQTSTSPPKKGGGSSGAFWIVMLALATATLHRSVRRESRRA